MILSILANTTHHWVSPNSKTGFTIKSASKQRNHQLTILPHYWSFRLRPPIFEYAKETFYPNKQQLRSDLVNCAVSRLPAREPTWCCVLASLPVTTNYSVPIFQINRKCSKLKIFCPVIWWLNTEGAQISQIFIAFNTWTIANHQLKSPNTPKCQISSNSLRSRAANISRLVLSVLSSWARAAEWFVLLRLYLCFAIISSCCANYSWAGSLSNVVEIFMFRC